MISLKFLNILAPLQKLPKNVGDLGKLIVAAGFEIVAQSPINCPIWTRWLQTSEQHILISVLFRVFQVPIPVFEKAVEIRAMELFKRKTGKLLSAQLSIKFGFEIQYHSCFVIS